MKLAFLFAGQGSQKAGMGRELYENFSAFRKAFEAAKLGFDLKRVCFEDPDGVINQTQYTQPCMVAFAAGVNAVLRENGIVPQYAAGLSLGEYSALHCAGVFTAKQAIELTAYRGAAMAKAAEGVESAMTAVLMLDRETLERCCEEASDAGVVRICNYNCPGQLVIGGEKAAVAKAGELAKAAGARRLMPLRVSGPFHTPLMQPACEALAKRFENEAFGEMEIPVLFNCLGDMMGEGDTIPALLCRQVKDSVYMEDTIRNLQALGVDTVIEIGPGRALSGFVGKTAGNAISCYAVEDIASLEAAIAAVKA
ncbi:MAG: ACP S-malonyltransferase [Clostridia bacterium]|nr:ACP S-malonyltransferase [Clostridia bacterium]